MQRIVKRFLLRSHRENEKTEEGDSEQLNQDLQLFKSDMYNDLKRARINTLKSLSFVYNGVSVIGEEMLKDSYSKHIQKFNFYKSNKTSIEQFIDSES